MKKFLLSLGLILMGFAGMGQGVIASWGFEGITTTNTGMTISVTGSSVADAGVLTAGSTFTSVHTSASTVYSNPSGNGSLKAVSSNNWAVGDYFQFKASTTGFTGINVTWQQTGSNTGPAQFKLQYSTTAGGASGYAWVTTGTPAGASAKSFNLASITALNNASEIYFRLTQISTVSINAGTVAVAGTSRIDNFSINYAAPLPITLISFKANITESQQTVLKWATASEKDNDYFEIERSKNALDFESVGKIKGKGTIDLRNDYTFTDESPLKGINYYRLKQVDFDGQYSYTRAESVIRDGDGTISLFPNPTANILKINFEDTEQIENTTIYNLMGRVVKTISGNQGKYEISELPQGKYILQIGLSDGRIIRNSFVKN
jgi:hypothetical protein